MAKRHSLLFIFYFIVSCDSTIFDFEQEDPACDFIKNSAVAKCKIHEDLCFGQSEITTRKNNFSMGCATDLMPASALKFEKGKTTACDVFIWAYPENKSDRFFSQETYLEIFSGECGQTPLGISIDAGNPNCKNNPWVFLRAVSADDLFLHVLSSQEKSVTMGYQVVPSNYWKPLPPPSFDILASHHTDSLTLLDGTSYLINETINLSKIPPSSYPRICPQTSAGWRQASFLISCQGNCELEKAGEVELSLIDSENHPIVFTVAIIYAQSDGNIKSDSKILALSCDTTPQMQSKKIELIEEPKWNSEQKYALVIQIPPAHILMEEPVAVLKMK